MRDPQRERWESDPSRPLVQSRAWNRAVLIWSFGLPIIVLLAALLGYAPGWTTKSLIVGMMLAFGSGSVLEICGWLYERVKYRDR
jgi:hypothetical protein